MILEPQFKKGEYMRWFENNPQRFDYELALLKKYYASPATRCFIERGSLKMKIMHQIIGRKYIYLARIVYPDGFPYDQIDTFIDKPRIPNLGDTIHMFNNRSLCLARPEQIGPQISGKIIIDWLRDWICGYEIYLDTGKFPDELPWRR